MTCTLAEALAPVDARLHFGWRCRILPQAAELMVIRPFAPDDLPGILVIQQQTGAGNSWSGEDYSRLSQEDGGLILVACEAGPAVGRVAGFAALRCVFDHAELLNLAVDPDRRRQGIGRSLLLEACRLVHERGAKALSLEVRPSNSAALHLYRSAGFTLQKIRKAYYSDPVEDGLVLALKLPPVGTSRHVRCGKRGTGF